MRPGKENTPGGSGNFEFSTTEQLVSPCVTAATTTTPTSQSSSIVVYDHGNAIAALQLVLDRENVSVTEAARLSRQIVKYLEHANVQRQSQLESAAGLSTRVLQLEQELAGVKAERDDLKRGAREMKRVVGRLEGEKVQLAGEVKDVRIALEFARQKEGVALEAAKRAGAEVEAVRKKAEGRVEGMKRRLEALEVQGYLRGGEAGAGVGRGGESVQTVDEAAAAVGAKAASERGEVTSGRATVPTVPIVPRGRSHEDTNSHEQYRVHRSEMGVLERKLDKSNALLAKTTKAAQKIQDKLVEERKKVAGMLEERRQLQEQIVGLQSRPQGMDVDQVSKLMHDLATARSKVEHLDQERSALQGKLSELRSEMSTSTEAQKRALLEADAVAAKALEEEQLKVTDLVENVSLLLSRLKDAEEALTDFEATQASLEESQKRCAELAGMLDVEQRASYERSMEVERLAKAAQACAAELVDMREELRGARSAAQRLENENAGLVGRCAALSEAVSSQEKSSEVIESLAEGRALLQSRLASAERERDELKSQNESLETRLAEAQTYVQELELLLDSLQEELSQSESKIQSLDSALTAKTSDLECAQRQNAELASSLDDARNSLERSRRSVESLQKELEDSNADLVKAKSDFEDMCDCLKASEDNGVVLLEEKNALAQHNGRLEVEVEHLKLTINRLDKQVEDSKGATASLEASLRAAEVQCDALRKANIDAQKDSLTMVDSMNELSNLIDSVNELQARVHELQVALAASQAKVSKLEDDKAAMEKEIQIYENHVANSQERMSDMRSASEEDKARYAQAVRRLDAVTLQLDAVRKELEHKVLDNSEKQAQIVELLALDASNADEIASTKKRVKGLKKALAESSDRVQALEQEVDEYAYENKSLLEAQAKLQESLEQTRASLEATEGKLVVSQTRVERLEEATRHVEALTKEFEGLRSKYKSLVKQQSRDAELYEQLSSKYDEASKDAEEKARQIEARDADISRLGADVDACRKTIDELRESEGYLEEEVARLSVLEPQVALLQSHINDGGAWCEAATAALETRAKEVEAALAEVRSSRHEYKCISQEMAVAQERASAAEASAALSNERAAEAELARDAALKAMDAMKEEIFVLSSQHKEMMDVTESMREAEEEASRKFDGACEQLHVLRGTVDGLKEQLHASDVHTCELKSKLHHVTEMRDQTVSENESLRDSVCQLDKSLSAASTKMSDADRELDRVNGVCTGLREALEDTSLSLMESESMVGNIELELSDCKTTLAAEQAASKVMREQCETLERELDFLQDTLTKDTATSEKLGEVILFIGDERAQFRADIANLNRLIDGMREELNVARAEARDLHESKEQAETKLLMALGENKELAEGVASLQRDMAVLDVVKEQLERDAVVQRDEATRAKLFCSESEREVSKLRNDYQLFNQAMQGRLSAFEPILRRIEATVAEGLRAAGAASFSGMDVEVEKGDASELIEVPAIPEQGERILKSLQRVERRVAALAESADGFAARQRDHEEAAATWQSHKRVFKAVTKLSVAIALDVMSGTQEASAMHDKLSADGAVTGLLCAAGLQNIWDSLSKLVLTKPGVKSAKKLQQLSTDLDDARSGLAAAAEDLANARAREAKLSRATEDACRAMVELRNSLDGLSGGTPVGIVDIGLADRGGDLAQEVDLCVDMLKTSVSIVLRRYRSMARNITGTKASGDGFPRAGVAGKQARAARRESGASDSDKIGAAY